MQLRCHKMVVIFLNLELGIFSMKLGKNILFAFGNMTQYRSSKWAKKLDSVISFFLYHIIILLLFDFVSEIDITPCSKIDKLLVVYRL